MMAGRYQTLYQSITSDLEFRAFSSGAQLVFYTLKFCKENNAANLFEIYTETLCKRNNMPKDDIEMALMELEAKGWIKRQGELMWIVKGLKNNPSFTLNNVKHRKALLNCIEELPKTLLLKLFMEYYNLTDKEFHALYNSLSDTLSDGNGIPNGKHVSVSVSVSVSEDLFLSGQNHEENPDPVDNSVDNPEDDPQPDDPPDDPPDQPPPPEDNVPHKKIIEAWNTMMIPLGLQAVRSWSKERAGNLRARCKEDKARLNPEWWKALFEEIKKSDFCMGKIPPAPGHTQFKITLPWLILPNNFAKVIEGNYSNKQKAAELTEPQKMIQKAIKCHKEHYEVKHVNCGFSADCCQYCICSFIGAGEPEKYHALLKEHGCD